MKFSVETAVQVSNVRGTRSLDALALHCTRNVPNKLPKIASDFNEVEEKHAIGLVDYSCRLRASGDQEAKGKATLTITTTVVVFSKEELNRDDDEENDDEDKEPEELDEVEVAARRAVAKRIGTKFASQDLIAGDSGAEVTDFEVEINLG